MSSNVQICNVALSAYCGAQIITSLDEDTPQAEACALHLDDVKRQLFERNWWTFAKARQVLAELTNDRTGEWAYCYQQPADALSIHWVNDAATARIMLSAGRSPDAPRERSGEKIYSDVQTATCEFTRFISDPALYPQYFSDCLSAFLATRIVSTITQDATRIRAAQDAAQMQMELAIALDARNDPPIVNAVPGWLSDRGIS